MFKVCFKNFYLNDWVFFVVLENNNFNINCYDMMYILYIYCIYYMKYIINLIINKRLWGIFDYSMGKFCYVMFEYLKNFLFVWNNLLFMLVDMCLKCCCIWKKRIEWFSKFINNLEKVIYILD